MRLDQGKRPLLTTRSFEEPPREVRTDFTLAFEADIISGGQTIWDLHV